MKNDIVAINILKRLDFTKCSDNNYRRIHIHDYMYIKVDEDGIWIYAEDTHKDVEILITLIQYDKIYAFEDWFNYAYN